MINTQNSELNSFYKSKHGEILNGDSLVALRRMKESSVDLVMTSPPFGLVRKKEYGNVDADKYVIWFQPFAKEIYRVLKDSGSFVLDIGGAWNQGRPTRHLYHFKLLIMLCEEYGFHLAQDYYWWNPSKLPTPAEWVTVRRIRVKDAINCVWWLSKTPWPKASNKRVLQPYSDSMKDLLKNGYKAMKRPSGHDISEKFNVDNKASIPPNLLAMPNTESNSQYLNYCKEMGLKTHPARFPSELPEYFIRMLTDKNDKVVDPFAGSCVTGEVAERLARKWVCIEISENYLEGALARFDTQLVAQKEIRGNGQTGFIYYKIPKPGALWKNQTEGKLPQNGGSERIGNNKPKVSLPFDKKE